MITIEEAATKLHERLKDNEWYLAVKIGLIDGRPGLYLYVVNTTVAFSMDGIEYPFVVLQSEPPPEIRL